MVIRHNLAAMNANRQLNITTKKKAKVSEKLSSGYKLNRAADDAAGLAISEKMRRLIRGLNQAAENVQEGVGYVQVADGALNEVHDILHRMNELAVKSANGTNQDTDRQYLDSEVQQLKSELDRIFDTTSFNEKIIWEPDPDLKKQIGVEQKQAVTMNSTSNSFSVTNANCGVLAYSEINGNSTYYKINADTSGIKISWTGFDGNNYETETIDWDTLKANNYSFEMSDYFGPKDASNKLYDSNGNPVFTHKVAFTPQETATIDDMITCLNGINIGTSCSASMTGRFETADGTGIPNSTTTIAYNGCSLYYAAAYASKHNTGASSTSNNIHDFDNADDVFIEPADASGNVLTSTSPTGNVTSIPTAAQSKDLAAAKTSTENWEMSFYMDGIGKVTGTSSKISYWGPSDLDTDDEGHWWRWQYTYNSRGEIIDQRKVAISHTASEYGSGTLGSLMAALTGAKGTSTPGILTSTNGGDCDNGGQIEITFDLTSEQSYTYGAGLTSNKIGSVKFLIRVSSTDTEQTVLNKISDCLNSSTIFDFYSASATYDSARIGKAIARSHKIDVPIYGGGCELIIQAGPEEGDQIHILYDSLSTIELGINNTNILTQDACADAIADIEIALEKVSAQRATFGAYQNRLEHAYNNNKNIEENTQAAESQIRDTDMALTMVEYSNLNILQQAGQAMLTQTNSSQQAVLHLLQNI